MLAELTLKIEKPIIEKAQQYAYEQNINLSKVVGDYLQELSANTNDTHHNAFNDVLNDALNNVLNDSDAMNNEPSAEQLKKRQLGFMKGEIKVPDDINWGDDEILAEFGYRA